MTPDEHRRRYVTNLGQMYAGIHDCARPGAPVCEGCRLRARATYDQLRARQPIPA